MNVYFPTRDDILSWAYGPATSWPAEDWDYYVLDPAHDGLIFELANDSNCPQRRFFVHALYYLVGSTFNRGNPSVEKTDRIKRLVAGVGSTSLPDVVTWKLRVEQLLRSEIEFDVEMWLHHLFNSQGPG